MKIKIILIAFFFLSAGLLFSSEAFACISGECRTTCFDTEKPTGETCSFSAGDYNQAGACCVKKSGSDLTSGKVCSEDKGMVAGRCYVSGSAGLMGCAGIGPGLALGAKGEMGCPSDQICCKTQEYQDATQGKPETGSTAPSSPTPTATSGSRGDSTASGLVPCDTNCTLCHLVVGFKRIFDFFIKLLFVATMMAITISGVFYMVSTGNKKVIEMAKTGLTYSLMAFVIGMGSWIIINTIMVGLGFKHPYGGNWWEFTCDTSKSAGPIGSGTNPNWAGGKAPSGNAGTCGGMNVTQNSNQCKDTSSQLAGVLECINGRMANIDSKNNFALKKIPGMLFANAAGGATISSLGQNQNGGNWQACVGSSWNAANCPHSQYSCHYGGTNCQGQINGADLTGNMPAIKDAAIACGADTVIYGQTAYFGGQSKSASDHNDHVHISVNNQMCGCDYLK